MNTRLRLGMTLDEVTSVLGPDTQEITEDGEIILGYTLGSASNAQWTFGDVSAEDLIIVFDSNRRLTMAERVSSEEPTMILIGSDTSD
jgi:hypothetical protein